MKKILTLLFLIVGLSTFAQEKTLNSILIKNKYVIKSNPRLSNPFGININLGGQTALLFFIS